MNNSTSSPTISPTLQFSRSQASFKSIKTSFLKPLKSTLKSPNTSLSTARQIFSKRAAISKHIFEESQNATYMLGSSVYNKTPDIPDFDIHGYTERKRFMNEISGFPNTTTNNDSRDARETKRSFTLTLNKDSISRRGFGARKELEKSRETSTESTLRLKQYMVELNEALKKEEIEPTTRKAKLCCKILAVLSSEEGQYEKEMRIITKEINNSTFCHSQEILGMIERCFPGVVGRSNVFSQTYFELIKRIVKFFESYQREVDSKIAEKEKHIEDLNEELNRKDIQIQNLLQADHSDVELKYQKFEQAFDEAISELERVRRDRNNLFDDMNRLRNDTTNMLENTERQLIDQYGSHLRTLIQAKKTLQETVNQRDMEIEKLSARCKQLTSVNQSSLIKLKANKQELDILKSRIEILENENSKLSVRAAAGFEQLTPRPQLDPLLQFFGVEDKTIQSTQKKIELINTTMQESTLKKKD